MKQTKYYCDLCGDEILFDNSCSFQFHEGLLSFLSTHDIDHAHKNCLINLISAFMKLIDEKKNNILPEQKK